MNRERKIQRILDIINSNPGMFQYVVSDGDAGCYRCAACDSDDYAEDGPHTASCPAAELQALARELKEQRQGVKSGKR